MVTTTIMGMDMVTTITTTGMDITTMGMDMATIIITMELPVLLRKLQRIQIQFWSEFFGLCFLQCFK